MNFLYIYTYNSFLFRVIHFFFFYFSVLEKSFARQSPEYIKKKEWTHNCFLMRFSKKELFFFILLFFSSNRRHFLNNFLTYFFICEPFIHIMLFVSPDLLMRRFSGFFFTFFFFIHFFSFRFFTFPSQQLLNFKFGGERIYKPSYHFYTLMLITLHKLTRSAANGQWKKRWKKKLYIWSPLPRSIFWAACGRQKAYKIQKEKFWRDDLWF